MIMIVNEQAAAVLTGVGMTDGIDFVISKPVPDNRVYFDKLIQDVRNDVYDDIRDAFKPIGPFKGSISFDDVEDLINTIEIRRRAGL